MKKPKFTAFSIRAGETHMRANSPALFVIEGAQPYIWIGNDGPSDKGCYATITGRAKLRSIAKAIIAAASTK